MGTPAIAYKHITLNDRGVPVIVGANTRVIDVVLAQRAHGMSPEEICRQLPQLNMAQIHAALSYYWDHKEELDVEIQRRYDEMERLREKLGPSPLITKLKAHGKI